MANKSNNNFQFLTLGVICAITSVVVCYAIKPQYLGIRKAFSSLGAYPPTDRIFNTGFILAAIFVLIDGLKTASIFQKICRFIAAIGFAGLGIFQIEHGITKGNLHRLSGLIMLLAIIISMIGHVISEWAYSSKNSKIWYLIFTALAVISVTMSILSSAQFKIMSLQGLAQYIGLFSLAGWAVLDKNQQ